MTFTAFFSCQSTKEKNEFLPKEYFFPTDQIGNGKTFIYGKTGVANKTSFKDLFYISDPAGQFLLHKQYGAGEKFDSSKTTVDNKLIETFTFMSPDNSYIGDSPLKGEIKTEKIIDNGTKLGQKITEIVFTGNENVVTIYSESEYLKDTTLTWQGSQIECIVSMTKSKIKFSNKNIPLAKKEIEYSGTFYDARGIGALRYSSQTSKEISTWELLEIRDMK